MTSLTTKSSQYKVRIRFKESFQYKFALAITGAIKGMSKEKLYDELGLENLKDRRWM